MRSPRHARPLHLPLLTTALLLSLTAPALANDGSFGGQGADLVPLQNQHVRMVREDIHLTLETPRKKDGWRVVATYTFENTAKTPVTVQVGFPERQCDPEEGECNGDGKFHDMKTTIRGKVVKHRLGKVGKQHTWAPALGRVFLYDVKFNPGETLQIVHTYRYGRSPDVMGESLSYVTRTGALWKGPIGNARFTIKMPYRPWSISFPKEYKLIEYTERLEGKSGVTTIAFEQQNWTPKEDLDVQLQGSFTHTLGCPNLAEFENNHKANPVKAFEGIKDLKQIATCRNLPFAHHGYAFKKPQWHKLFYGEVTDVTKVKDSTVRFLPNPHYDPKLLTPIEGLYIKGAQAREKQLQGK